MECWTTLSGSGSKGWTSSRTSVKSPMGGLRARYGRADCPGASTQDFIRAQNDERSTAVGACQPPGVSDELSVKITVTWCPEWPSTTRRVSSGERNVTVAPVAHDAVSPPRLTRRSTLTRTSARVSTTVGAGNGVEGLHTSTTRFNRDADPSVATAWMISTHRSDGTNCITTSPAAKASVITVAVSVHQSRRTRRRRGIFSTPFAVICRGLAAVVTKRMMPVPAHRRKHTSGAELRVQYGSSALLEALRGCPVRAQDPVDQRVEPLSLVASPRLPQPAFVGEPGVRQGRLHRCVVVAGVGLDPVQLRVAREEMLGDPSGGLLAVAAASMSAGNSKIELGCANADVGEIEEPNQTDGLPTIDDPETGDIKGRKVHLAYFSSCQLSFTMERPLVATQKLDKLMLVPGDLHVCVLRRHRRNDRARFDREGVSLLLVRALPTSPITGRYLAPRLCERPIRAAVQGPVCARTR